MNNSVILKNIGIIKGDIEGTSVCYCINEKKWGEIRDVLVSFFQQDIIGKECC